MERFDLPLDPELRKILEERGWPPPFMPTVENIDAFRARWRAGTARFAASPTIADFVRQWDICCDEKDINIPVRDGKTIQARVYIPREANDNIEHTEYPLCVMFHGGGYCLGGIDTEEVICRIICSRLRIVVLNVEYRLAPEHPFPTPVQDCVDATIWASENAAESIFGGVVKSLVVAGISGGATFAAVVSHVWKNQPRSLPIVGLFMSIPILDNDVQIDGKERMIFAEEFKSKQENAKAPILNESLSKRFWSIYQPDRASPLYCPLLFDNFNELPKTYFQVCELDPYRDGCLIYQNLLHLAGIETRQSLYNGLPHAFWTAYPNLTATKKWLEDTVDGIQWLLNSSLQNSTKDTSRL